MKITEKGKRKLVFDFKFLNPKDGFVVQLLHTGFPFDLRVDADVIGEKKRNLKMINKRKHRIKSGNYELSRNLLKNTSLFSCVLITVLFLIGMIVEAFFPTMIKNVQSDIIFFNAIMIITLILCWTMLIFSRKYDMYDYIPDEIRELLKY